MGGQDVRDSLTEKKNVVTLPELNRDNGTKHSHTLQKRPHSVPNNKTKHDIIVDNKPRTISFLSEKDATFHGEFRNRMMKSRGIGLGVGVGIANASHSFQYVNGSYANARTSSAHNPGGNYKDKEKRYQAGGKVSSNTWEPLSIHALVEGADTFYQRNKSMCVQ